MPGGRIGPMNWQFLIPILSLLGGCYEEKEVTLSSSNKSPINSSSRPPGRWPAHSLPLALRISENFSPKEINTLQDQADAWERAINNELDFFNYDFPLIENLNLEGLYDYKDNPAHGHHLGIYKSTKWPHQFGRDTLAITQFSGHIKQDDQGKYIHITHADIIFNYQDYTFSNNPQYSEFDFASVAIHELGHLLGLRHESKLYSPSVMRPFIHQQIHQRKPSKRDQKVLRTNYRLTVEKATLYSANLQIDNGEYPVGRSIQGVIELKTNGKCRHFLNQRLLLSHHAHSNKSTAK